MDHKCGQERPAIKELSLIIDSVESVAKAATTRMNKPEGDPTRITEAEAAVYTGPCFKAGERGCTKIQYYYHNGVLIVTIDTVAGSQEYHYPVDTIARVKVLY